MQKIIQKLAAQNMQLNVMNLELQVQIEVRDTAIAKLEAELDVLRKQLAEAADTCNVRHEIWQAVIS
jgi:hypothetical protein